MSKKVILVMTLFTLVNSGLERQSLITDSAEIKAFLDHYNSQAEAIWHTSAEAAWNYNTDITEQNQQRMLNQNLVNAKFNRESYINATKYNLAVMSPRDKRLFNKIMDIGTSAQNNETKLAYFYQLVSDMMTICSTASVTFPLLESLGLKPESNDTASDMYYKIFLALWVGSVATGDKIKAMYAEYVELSNEAVRILGHADTGAYWRSWYETPTFEDDVRALFDQLRPLYEQLHAYARRKLKQIYGNDKFPSSGHIPAHLLGNWMKHLKLLTPYKDKPSLDVTFELGRQNYGVLDLFKTADDFFKSLGMIQMPESFWNKSLFEKPTDGREVICHASAWDFGNGKDFRIKQCTEVTAEHLDTVHHEMGHVEYYLQYKDQPVIFRSGANKGFHEAVGDVISLSVQTPKHLHRIGLFPCVTDDDEFYINFLMRMALKLVAGLPFTYIIDKWRWSVFRGDTTPDRYNDEWWNLRGMYEGVSQPVSRDSSAFDPGSVFHVAADVPYVRYFVSKIIQFQFHKALCEKAGHIGPLHKCDIYNSKEAGTLLSEMLKLGSSKPWPEAMYVLTGQYKMDARPLMDYFEPLLKYLRQENGNDYGWHPHYATSSQESVSRQNKALLTFVLTTVTTALLSSCVF